MEKSTLGYECLTRSDHSFACSQHHHWLGTLYQAFIGGLDLCFGRWDDMEHPVVDDNHIHPLHPGKDYINPDVWFSKCII